MSYANTTPPRSQFGLRGMEGGVPVPAFKSLQGEAVRREAENSKRTVAITLVALGAGAVGLYFLAGSSRIAPGTPQIYANVAQCVASGAHASGVCEAQWNEASKVHDRAAPDYATMQACEAAHGAGKCVRPATPDDAERAAKYIPMMSGYFFGQTQQGTFAGVPLYTMVSDGAGSYRVAELRPKDPDAAEEVKKTVAGSGDGAGQNGGSTSRTLLFVPLPATAASAPASAPAAGRPAFAPGSAAPAVSPGAHSAAPAAAANPAASPATTRGGLGTAARSAGVSGGG